MKTLLLLLALAVSVHGQTLKWEVTFETPTFQYDQALGGGKSDVSGWSGVCIEYSDSFFAPLGVQFAWYTNAGKLVFHEIDPAFKDGLLVQCSSVCAVVQYVAQDGSKIFRKYTRRGAVITKADTPIGKFDNVGVTEGTADRAGFFLTVRSPDGNRVLGMKRYSYR